MRRKSGIPRIWEREAEGKGAELAKMERVDFIMELGRRGIPVIDLDEDEIEEELSDSREDSS